MFQILISLTSGPIISERPKLSIIIILSQRHNVKWGLAVLTVIPQEVVRRTEWIAPDNRTLREDIPACVLPNSKLQITATGIILSPVNDTEQCNRAAALRLGT
ncbi:hypothetical protein ACMFMF_006070 [Clarireedia jacksonii]